ncbi:helicase-exonuclease AddAB subunit AddB [Diplocloster modestus]|uniref:Helicase-exonuclease AddAB subunit AddB n=1 Tax=Diplocloster modestus TaxID=2850322 RepID=A0ABS6K1F6_9FIRM|nr:helicase-exonuclease AddAB subunit AddB [Diplocloster modestus]MBU9724682.1 helicase-exonuclease AddAB subunit AddB [Diplocloster modestus]
MSLQIILGNAGAGKSTCLYEEMIRQSIEYPDQKYFVIVPEQFTMQTQMDLVRMHPRGGVLNIDILSFERLAYRIFDELGGNHCLVLEETGKNLVLQKIAEEKREDLKLLGGSIRKPGYIREIKSVISEFTQYGVEDEQLEEMIRFADKNPRLQWKLQDIRVLYDAFRQYLKDRYITAEQVLEVLCHLVERSRLLKDSVIALDGFTGFTPVQNQLLEKLLRTAGQIWVTVTLDGRENPMHLGADHQLFYMSKKTIRGLMKLAETAGARVKEPIVLNNRKNPRFREAPALAWLEQHLYRYGKGRYEKEQDQLTLYCSQNPMEEVEETARRILALVRDRGFRYREIAVVAGDISVYGNYVRKVFAEYGIPSFIDQKRNILMNPAVEWIRSLLQMADQNFSYESVFRYLRCGLSGFTRRETDLLENYCIALGIRGFSKWKQKWVRSYPGLTEEELAQVNILRDRFAGEMADTVSVLGRKGATVEEITKAVYELMVRREIQLRLKEYEEQFKASGNMDLAKEYSQVYRILMDLFDKLIDLLGDARIVLREYAKILDAGFEEAKVGVIPMEQDLVLIGDVERTRLNEIQVLFFLGANDGLVPKAGGSGGILSDMDRELLAGSDVELAPTARQNVCIQKFYLYLVLTKPSRQLYISFSKVDSGGKTLRPSSLVGTLRKLFPGLIPEEATVGLTMEEAGENLESEEAENRLESEDDRARRILASRVMTLESGIHCLAEQMQDNLQNPTAPYKELFSWYRRDPGWGPVIRELAEVSGISNSDSRISRAVANVLYGTVLENSVTRLERYASCACAHFLDYGLRLTERAEYSFEAVDLGTVFHRALEVFGKKLNQSGYSWFTLDDQKREELTDAAVEEVVTDYGNMVLYSSARNTYLLSRMKRLLRRTTWALSRQLEKGGFTPGDYEISFSNATNLDSVNIALSAEERLRLQGRIDRVDVCEDGDNLYVKVVDYKSGSTAFDLVALYYGLQLQLVVYLNAAMEIEQKENPGKHVIPAGILYYNLKDPILDRKETEQPEEIQERLLSQLQMNGLVNADREIIDRMDQQLSGRSQVIPVCVNKDGSLSKSSSVASSEEFRTISDYVNQKIVELGKGMLDGNIKAEPYELSGQTACDYCPYRAVCGFDEKLDGFARRRFNSYQPDEILRRMKEEV